MSITYKPLLISGTVISGLGEGSYFVSLPYYNNAFAQIIGQKPFSGTLNLLVDSEERSHIFKKISFLSLPGTTINHKTFGGVSYCFCTIKNISCLFIIPEINKHNNTVIELISSFNLRETLHLSDHSLVTIHIP